jgi:toxin ParE1/3/4
VRLEVHPVALREIHKVANAYDKKAHRLGDRFTDQVEHAFARLRERPLIGEEIARGERRLLLRRFPYRVIYRVHDERIFVVAVAHHKRRDGYWRRRRDPA